ncbi:hypothetical protein AB205_0099250, partial [Aquarana catesbeiana]
ASAGKVHLGEPVVLCLYAVPTRLAEGAQRLEHWLLNFLFLVPLYALYVTTFLTVGIWCDCVYARQLERNSVGKTFRVYSDSKTGHVYRALETSALLYLIIEILA